MTTPTPTSDAAAAGAQLPGDLPDIATLARWAGEFFAAVPGGPSAGAALPVGGPSALGAASGLSGPVLPSLPGVAGLLLPQGGAASPRGPAPQPAAGNEVPDAAATTLPAAGGRSGGAAQGVPQAYAAALPPAGIAPAFPSWPGSLPGAPSVPVSTPYYFLGEASALPSAATGGDRVTAQSFALPGAGDLQALLGTVHTTGADRSAAAATPGTAPQAPPAAEPGGSPFYFIDLRSAPSGHAGTPPQAASTGSPQAAASAHPPFDVQAIRRDFPILAERVNGRPLIWFDNAATTQKPQAVIDRLAYFYAHENSNIHRAAHELAARATDAYEAARRKVARFLGAASAEEIIFVRGATEAINLVARSWGAKHIGPGDEIIVSHLEHHANIVPWQQLAGEKGARLRVIPVDDRGQVLLEEYTRLLNERTKLVAVTQVSNALGTVVPVKEIVDLAHRAGACALVDGAQSVSHLRVDVQALDADFFVFSGHKIFAPTGIGVVYGKRKVLEDTPPWQGGGNMIQDVTFERTVFQGVPARFEAGTGNIADAVGLGAALDYVERIGLHNIARYEHDLLAYATHGLQTVPGLRLIGTAADKASVASFVLDGYRTEEVGQALNREGIAVRAGHHCAQPILRRFGLEATVRPSLAFYNTCEEVDALIAALLRLAGARRS
jgi:cysteine desulfurase/selenocysteine lyase